MLKNAGSKVSTISENSSNRKVLEGEGDEKLQFYLLQLSELKALKGKVSQLILSPVVLYEIWALLPY